jgi:hypothetical protein
MPVPAGLGRSAGDLAGEFMVSADSKMSAATVG